MDNESDVDSIQYGVMKWRWDAAIPYNRESVDAEDDLEIKVLTQ